MLKLEHQTLNDRAYGALKQELISGGFSPGQTLVIRKLAETFGISTTPIREALQRLVAERLLEMQNNRSVIVPLLSAPAFEELTRIRIAVEGLAGEMAATRMSESGLADIQATLAGMQRAIEAGDARAYLSLNEAFHFAIYQQAGAPILLNMIRDLWGRVGPYLKLLMQADRYIPHSNDAHRKIVAALEQRSGPTVRVFIEEDIAMAAAVLSANLDAAR
ncbi:MULTISPECIES: GntR family transcriptional regulator [unclassified Mesorhizobium]|uniref:GntR family transcriptional regulator n=1 Tax=unclassified Mesorhizobium TaxID=325217 RepID=UPI000FCA4894|nr:MULTISPECIES: GntR family transcriptional regulator [unclassified Mesorhizobium]RUU65948.1 GntR family transcriptional regulator [Mesorhizobium sp. M7A.T.Ca.TU.009.01.1.1]RUU80335.1 GntR family transcriptional regulator [Mesorhizobium sp. M7A.T.Ca.TU.009.01.1.2]RUT89603.1 GntR family transcriptional regulator [Mesorhizobium sp. M7A.T.Ca.US.000.02.1.1]RUT92652.1 GntR family transcriptional regulator [Mesorhizobium sp. M7A.T.Ca.US.000.02.2.1]RUU05491.1 GntR family transcriptional regulator [M